MATSSPAVFSSFLNLPNSKIAANPADLGFPRIRFLLHKKKQPPSPHLHPYTNPIIPPIGDCSPSSSSSGSCCYSATITNSLTLDQDSIDDEEVKKAESIVGSKARVKETVKVYHVPKVPEIDLAGKVGVVKQYVGIYKGKRISANLPYKVEFLLDEVSGRDGKPVKFVVHLRDDEFELLD